MKFVVRPVEEGDRGWIRAFICAQWHAESVVSRGTVLYPHELEGYVAEREGGKVGLATYAIRNCVCELVTLNSIREREGIGSALVQAVIGQCRRSGAARLWLVTSNDNLPALAFYQKRGFRIAAVHPGAIERARLLKPSIPLRGIANIPIRDEIELEMLVGAPGRDLPG